jgi:hypothetical protein
MESCDEINFHLFILFLRFKLRRILNRYPQNPLISQVMMRLINTVNEFTPQKIKLLDERILKK